MTHLTDKREAPVSAVGVSGMAAHRASFARRVGIDLESHTARTSSFIGDHAVQLGKGPFGVAQWLIQWGVYRVTKSLRRAETKEIVLRTSPIFYEQMSTWPAQV